MRPIYVLMGAILLGVATLFQACSTGDPGPAGPSGVPTPYCSSPSSQGVTGTGNSTGIYCCYLVSIPVTLTSASTAVSLSMYVTDAAVTGQLRLGLYTDNTGTPNRLVAQTNPKNIAAGWNTIPIPATYLPIGTYWITLSYSNDFDAGKYTAAGTEYEVAYPWGVMPTTYPSGGGPQTTYYWPLYVSTCP